MIPLLILLAAFVLSWGAVNVLGWYLGYRDGLDWPWNWRVLLGPVPYRHWREG